MKSLLIGKERWKGLATLIAGAVVLLLFCTVYQPHWETNDDFWLGNLASGALGESSNFLVFVHHGLGTLLQLLYGIIPEISWIGVIWMAVVILSLTAVLWVFWENLGSKKGSLVWLGILFGFGHCFLFQVNFTRVAAAALIAGYLLIFQGLKGKKLWEILWGMALCWTGYMVRYDMFLPITALAGGIGLAELFQGMKLPLQAGKIAGRVKASKSYFIVFLLLFLGAGLLNFSEQRFVNSDPQRAEYTAYNTLRSSILDYPLTPFEEIASELEECGISQGVYEGVTRHGIYYDPENITLETLQQILALQKNREISPWNAAQNMMTAFGSNRIYYNCLLCLAAAVVFSPKRRWFILGWQTAMVYLLNYYLSLSGRDPARVMESICAAAGIYMLWTIPAKIELTRAKAMACGAAILLVAAVKNRTFYLDANNYGDFKMVDWIEESLVDVEEMSDRGRYYWCSLEYIDALVVRIGMEQLDTLPEDSYAKMLICGGWTSYHPVYMEQLETSGTVNPNREIFYRDDLLLVGTYRSGGLLWYLQNAYAEEYNACNLSVCGKVGPYMYVMGFAQDQDAQVISSDMLEPQAAQVAGDENDLVWIQAKFQGDPELEDSSNIYFLNIMQEDHCRTYRGEIVSGEEGYELKIGLTLDQLQEGPAQVWILRKDASGELERTQPISLSINLPSQEEA